MTSYEYDTKYEDHQAMIRSLSWIEQHAKDLSSMIAEGDLDNIDRGSRKTLRGLVHRISSNLAKINRSLSKEKRCK